MEVQGKFELPVKTAILKFKDTDYAGAEVKVRLALPMDRFLAYMGAIKNDTIAEVVEGFGDDVILSWNLTKDGEPIPANGKTVLTSVDMVFMMLLMSEWTEVMQSPPDPLFEPSRNGKSAEEATIGMESLSPNPES